LVLIACAACVPNGELGGSISGNYDLRFDRVRAYWLASDLVIIYERDYSPASPSTAYGDPVVNQVARLTFHTDKQALETDVDIPYVRDDGPGLGMSAERYVLEERTGGMVQEPQLPDIFEARIRFEKLGRKTDKPVRGEFECTFIDDRFLWGTFDTLVSKP
jgi:hypothetical protein